MRVPTPQPVTSVHMRVECRAFELEMMNNACDGMGLNQGYAPTSRPSVIPLYYTGSRSKFPVYPTPQKVFWEVAKVV